MPGLNVNQESDNDAIIKMRHMTRGRPTRISTENFVRFVRNEKIPLFFSGTKLPLTATLVAISMHRLMQLASSQVFVRILTALWPYEKLSSPTGWPIQRELVEGDSPWNPATRTPRS